MILSEHALILADGDKLSAYFLQFRGGPCNICGGPCLNLKDDNLLEDLLLYGGKPVGTFVVTEGENVQEKQKQLESIGLVTWAGETNPGEKLIVACSEPDKFIEAAGGTPRQVAFQQTFIDEQMSFTSIGALFGYPARLSEELDKMAAIENPRNPYDSYQDAIIRRKKKKIYVTTEKKEEMRPTKLQKTDNDVVMTDPYEEKYLDMPRSQISHRSYKRIDLARFIRLMYNHFSDEDWNEKVIEETVQERHIQEQAYDEYRYDTTSLDQMRSRLWDILSHHQNSCKIKISLGVFLEGSKWDDVLDKGWWEMIVHRSWTSGTSNCYVNFAPRDEKKVFEINQERDKQQLMSFITHENLKSSASAALTDSGMLLIGIFNMVVKVAHTGRVYGGSEEIPQKYMINRHLFTFPGKEDKRCFWRGLATHYVIKNNPEKNSNGKRGKNVEKPTKELFRDFYGDTKNWKNYPGVMTQELSEIEEQFQIGISLFTDELESTKINLKNIRRHGEYTDVMSLLIHKEHVMLIKNLNDLTSQIFCDKCGNPFARNYNIVRHKEVCVGAIQQDKFALFPKFHQPEQNVMFEVAQTLQRDTAGLDFTYDYLATYDYESFLQPIPDSISLLFPSEVELLIKEYADIKTRKLDTHMPVSVGVACNVPGFEEPRCFIADANGVFDPTEMNKQLVDYLLQASVAAAVLMQEKFACLFGFDDFSALCDHLTVILRRSEPQNDGLVKWMKKNVKLYTSSEPGREAHPETWYRAIKQIKHFPTQITNAQEAKEVKGVGVEVSAVLSAAPFDTFKPTLNVPPLVTKLRNYCKQLPTAGYNSAKYDLNLNRKSSLFSSLFQADGAPTFTVRKANSYMCIATDNLKLLDEANYQAAHIPLADFLKANDTEVGKFFWPYDWFDSMEKLKVEELPPKEAFWSELKKRNTLGNTEEEIDKNYLFLQQTWEEKGWKSMRDMLVYYNVCDVQPFLQACLKTHAAIAAYEIDKYKDAISLPGIASKIMFQKARQTSKKLPSIKPDKVPDYVLKSRRQGYVVSDAKMGASTASLQELRDLVEKSNYRCVFCSRDVSLEGFGDLSFDRIGNQKGHEADNLSISCLNCNVRRKQIPFQRFMAMTEIDRIGRAHPQIKCITEENKQAFYALKEVPGGPSIVFHRQAEVGETHISKPRHKFSPALDIEPHPACLGDPIATSCSMTPDCVHPAFSGWYLELGATVKKIVGKDANALYLWCLGQPMPCGNLKYHEGAPKGNWEQQVREDKLFGFFVVDIEVPETLYDKFAEFPPLFVHSNIRQQSAFMQATRDKLNKPVPRENKKVISCLKATKRCLYSPLLKWYLEKGLIVTKVHNYTTARPNKLFKKFMDWVSDERRKGDLEPRYAPKADEAKTIGNAGFGTTGMNKNRHEKVAYCGSVEAAITKQSYWMWKDTNVLVDGKGSNLFEIRSIKKFVKQDQPQHVASAVYDLAKLRMLQYYYDYMQEFFNPMSFQLIQMDTDSMYMSVTKKSEEKMLKPGMKERWLAEKHLWEPDISTPEKARFNRRVPGLFKIEKEGQKMIALCAKSYIIDTKAAHKGVQKRNTDLIHLNKYKECLFGSVELNAENRGFRVFDNEMTTYSVVKTGLTPIYDKRLVAADGVSTFPLIQ